MEGKSRHWTLVERHLLFPQDLAHFVQVVTGESNMVQRAGFSCGPPVKSACQVNDRMTLAVEPVTGKIEVRAGTVDQSQHADVEISKFIEILRPAPDGVVIESSDMHECSPGLRLAAVASCPLSRSHGIAGTRSLTHRRTHLLSAQPDRRLRLGNS